MNRKSPHQNLGIAACAISVTPAGEIQLFSAGEFRSNDGRPIDAPHWFINAELAAAIIVDFEARRNKTVIDYEHQTLLSAKNGQPAPAAAWFSKLEWRDTGLFAVNIEWTTRAAGMIEGGEYKYISPVFIYDKKTGAIKRLLHAALTNNPALDGMDAVAANQYFQSFNQQHHEENPCMDKLLEQIRWALNMPVTATAEDLSTQFQKAIDQIKVAATSAASAPGFDIVSLITSQADQIATLAAAASNPDPARFVAVATMKALHDEVAALRAEKIEREVSEVVQAALSSGKILPPQEAWARSLGRENVESLKAYLETAQPVAALNGTQTQGIPPVTGTGTQLDENQLAVCKATGVDPADFAKTLKAQQAQA